MTTDLPAIAVSYVFHGSATGAKSVRDDFSRSTVPFYSFPQKRKCSQLITSFGDVVFPHFALMIDSATKTMLEAIDLQKMPRRNAISTECLGA